MSTKSEGADQAQLSKLKSDNTDLSRRLASANRDLESARLDESSSKSESERLAAAVKKLEGQVTELKGTRAVASTAEAKNTAQLSAQISTLTRKNAEMESASKDADAKMEVLALDLDAARQEKEVLEEKVEELTLDFETSQIEVEELKEELEAATSLEDDGGEGGTEEEQMAVQNKKLRDALIRLREQSGQEKVR